MHTIVVWGLGRAGHYNTTQYIKINVGEGAAPHKIKNYRGKVQIKNQQTTMIREKGKVKANSR